MQVGWLTVFICMVLTLSGSGLYQRQPSDIQTDPVSEILENRMNQKSRKLAFFIPKKSAFREVRQSVSFDVFLHSSSPALQLYRNAHTRDAVIDFFISLIGSEEIALPVLYHANKYDISFLLVFSLMYTESRFLPDAVNVNSSSIDRGIFQLNSKSFPHLREEDFFNPGLNAGYAMSYLRWCMTHSSSQKEAIAMYNAGYGNIKSGFIPDSTKAYVQKIYTYRENLRKEFQQYLESQFDSSGPTFSALPN